MGPLESNSQPSAALRAEARVAERYPLTHIQEGMLFHSLLEPGSGVDIRQISVQMRARMVPRLLREFIDQSPWLEVDHRRAIYQDCQEEFLDIDQYARDRTIRRSEVLGLE